MNDSGLALPAASGGISDETAAFAAALIDRSGEAPVIEAALAHPTGRRRYAPCSPRWRAWPWRTGHCT